MDVSANILDAVQTAAQTSAKRTSSRPPSRRHQTKPRFIRSPSEHSSVEDLSPSDDSEQEHGYTTDLTSLPDSSPDERSPEDVEEFREREYPQLKGKTYLDHGGTTLYARSLMEEFSADMISNLYGNPHSASTPSAVAGHRVDAVRERALRFFNADPADFDLVFVANATAAVKLVIDCMRDHGASTNTPLWYGYHRDAHTSLVGPREMVKMHRCFTSDEEVNIWINSGGFGGPRARQLGLFAYPGQSNMTGRRLPLDWPGRIRSNFHRATTYTLLDAAALASTAPLDLSNPATAPDFVALSFYKIFGFPNVGALIVRKQSAHVLQQRRYFGGGTVEMVVTINDTWNAKKDSSIHDRLEDGTLPFHSIFALDHAMTVHERLYGRDPMKFISNHTARLGRQMYDALSNLKHSTTGNPLLRIYKDDVAVYGDPTSQGATIAFNVLRADGSLIGYADVEEAADSRGIYVRSGSLCNPGGMANYLNWTPADMRAAFAAGHRCSNPRQIVMGRPTGVVRVSLGAMSTAADIRTLVRFLEDVYLEKSAAPKSRLLQVNIPTAHVSPTLPLTPVSPSPLTLSLAQSAANAAAASDLRLPFSSPTTLLDEFEGGLAAAAPTEPERPRFNPADYAKYRKPWEEELRRGQWAKSDANAAFDAKSTPSDDGGLPRNGAPSIKARKFGRSMVNLLRNNKGGPGQFGQPGDKSTFSRPPVPIIASAGLAAA